MRFPAGDRRPPALAVVMGVMLLSGSAAVDLALSGAQWVRFTPQLSAVTAAAGLAVLLHFTALSGRALEWAAAGLFAAALAFNNAWSAAHGGHAFSEVNLVS